MQTFENIKTQVLTKVKNIKSILKANDELYVVCNVYSRFSIYIITENIEILNSLKVDTSSKLEKVEKIEKEGFIHKDLQKSRKNILDAKNIFYVDRHIDKLNWFLNAEEYYNSKTPIVCFYSFKGGLGRTTAMVTSGIALARMGYKIAMIDFDLEAPGLATLFSTDLEQAMETRGIVDFFVDVSSLNNEIDSLRISDYYFTVNRQDIVGKNGGELLLFPAIREQYDEESLGYVSKLSKINLLFQNQKPFLPDLLIDKIQSELNPDVILIDTRTGINEIGGLFLSRYADISFLFFFGNKQNMFGLKSILNEISHFKSKIYLINSPIPKPPLAKEVREFYLQNAYEIFSEQFYEEDKTPFINDETAPHYPIEIPFNDLAILADRTENLKAILEERGGENPYLKIAETIRTIIPKRIDKGETSHSALTNEDETKYENLLKAFKAISPEGTAASEYETFDKISDWFYPRRDYKFIFDKSKFLILGEKGAGKTALYVVLSNQEYALNLAAYLSRNSSENNEYANTEWIKAMDKGETYPSRAVFEGIQSSILNLEHGTMIRFWVWSMIKYTPESHLPDDTKYTEVIKIAKSTTFSSIVVALQHKNYSITLDELISEINSKLRTEQKYFTYIYDALDRELPEENDLRGKLISGLVDMWYSYSSRFSNIRAKIFLRRDIFDREVSFTDKVKVNNNSAEITWEYDQLLNVIWKRVLHTEHKLPNIFEKYFENGNVHKPEGLGIIPDLNEDNNRKLLSDLIGEYMGSNNKAFPYNWVIYHVSDAHKRIQPRSILNLFSKSASMQLDNQDFDAPPLRYKFMELVMSDVSGSRVTDIKEEYPNLKFVFDEIASQIKQFPVEEGMLNSALKTLIERKNLKLTSEEIKTKLIEIGVLYEYKFTRKDTERRYHIPDLYLFGMGLKRKGPGAHKVLFKKK